MKPMTRDDIEGIRDCRESTSFPWDKDSLYHILRYARKHDGPWVETKLCHNCPDDYDTDFIMSATDSVAKLCDTALALYDVVEAAEKIIEDQREADLMQVRGPNGESCYWIARWRDAIKKLRGE